MPNTASLPVSNPFTEGSPVADAFAAFGVDVVDSLLSYSAPQLDEFASCAAYKLSMPYYGQDHPAHDWLVAFMASCEHAAQEAAADHPCYR